MTDHDRLRDIITEEILRYLREKDGGSPSPVKQERKPSCGQCKSEGTCCNSCEDCGRFLSGCPEDKDAIARMKRATNARIGVGKAGARLSTKAMLKLRADHAQARDAVSAEVSQELLDRLGLFTVQSQCDNIDVYLTRPDLGRKLSKEGAARIKAECPPNPDVQIYASGGLSSTAVEANLAKILPVLTDALEDKGLTVGKPFYLRFGRVASEDEVAELVGCKVVCVLIGERPGLATAESMSAYLVYNAHVGIPEARRTVVSNIHKDGTAAAEAGAYIADMIGLMLEQKASGIDLKK